MGAVQQLMTASYNAEAFYGGPSGPNNGSPPGLLDIPSWASMGLGQAAQAVQVSAFPELYDRWAPTALAIMAFVNGTDLPQACLQAARSEDPSAPPVPADLSATRQAVLQYAQEGVGGAYVWGGTEFKAWDCSGYVQWIYSQVGIALPRTEQWLAGHLTATPQPGDLVVRKSGRAKPLGSCRYLRRGRDDVQRLEPLGGHAAPPRELESRHTILHPSRTGTNRLMFDGEHRSCDLASSGAWKWRSKRTVCLEHPDGVVS
ncbi:C40 family peptidase [Arthrobacter psychrolactophilus]